MTKEEIIELACQTFGGIIKKEERKNFLAFAKLVAEKEREACIAHAMTSAEKAIDVAIKLEREACANICEEKYYLAVADAIRARGKE